MQKLKAVFRSASRKRRQNSDGAGQHQPETTSSHPTRNHGFATSVDEQRPRGSSDAAKSPTQHHRRSRPLSSVHDSPEPSSTSETQPMAIGHTQPQNSHQVNESVASDDKAYLRALSPVHDAPDEQYTRESDRRLITSDSETSHDEDVAEKMVDRDRSSLDVSRRKPLPPVFHEPRGEDMDRKPSVDSAISSVRSGATGKYSVGRGDTTNSPLDISIGHCVHSSGMSRRNKLAVDGHEVMEKEIKQMLDGVVDLRNTVDEDKNVQWAPVVTHEVVKPHEHEIIQHRVFREIHNYEYHHRIQPIYDLEVLPPRHWIPNPDGEGLIEISADELPSRTGKNRRWKVVHEQVELPAKAIPIWRTEPEIIEHPTTTTTEGFERKETTIKYPPTLQDMSEYDGLVQPVHFDHKTGRRWLGEMTTMHKLRYELAQVSDTDLSLRELEKALPHVPAESDVPELSQSPSLRRRPVTGHVPEQTEPVGMAI